jgi:hypothetical protein
MSAGSTGIRSVSNSRTATPQKSQNRNESVVQDAVLCYGEQLESRQGGEIQPGPKTLWHGVINIELQQKVTLSREP